MANIFFTSCKTATELTEKKLSFGLSFTEELRLRVHHSICTVCTAYHKQSVIIDLLLNQQQLHFESIPQISISEIKSAKEKILIKISA